MLAWHLHSCKSQHGLLLLLGSNAGRLLCQDDKAMRMRKRTTSDEELHDMNGEKESCWKTIVPLPFAASQPLCSNCIPSGQQSK